MDTIFPSDHRLITRLLEGFWSDVFERFDSEPDITGELAGKIASESEKTAHELLENYFENGRCTEPEQTRIMLVYQAGIANVFKVNCFNVADYGRDARRLLQSDFRTCESFALGCAAVGAIVRSVHCNMAGDIISAHWAEDLDAAPFSDQFSPVREG